MPKVFNPSAVDRGRSAVTVFSDTTNSLLQMRYTDTSKDPNTPKGYASITIEKAGATDGNAIVFLDSGASATDFTQIQFSSGAVQTDPRGVDSSPTHYQVTTVGALIDSIRTNASDFSVVRRDCAADYPINNATDILALAATELANQWTRVMYRDVSTVAIPVILALRIGVPEAEDGGLIGLDQVTATVDSASGTDCTFTLSTDPDDTDATKQKVIGAWTRAVPDDTLTTLIGLTGNDRPQVYKGPLLLECSAATSMAANAEMNVLYFNATY